MEWRISFRNLFRNSRRTISTAVALVVGFVGLSLLGGQIYKTERSVRTLLIYTNHLGHISIYKKDGFHNLKTKHAQYQIKEDEVRHIHEILSKYGNDIEITGGFVTLPALLSNGVKSTPVLLRGISAELDEYVKTHPTVKTWLGETLTGANARTFKEYLQTSNDPISISKGVGELIGRYNDVEAMSRDERDLSVAGRTLDGDFNAVSVTIAAKHSTGMPFFDDYSAIVPLPLMQNLTDSQGLDHIVIYLKDPKRIKAVLSSLKSDFRKSNLDLDVYPFNDKEIGFFYVGTMGFLIALSVFFALLIFGAAGLIIINSMTMTILERSKEMGTMRSMGFTPKRIRSLFIKEAIWISLGSIFLGILISESISFAINRMGIMYLSPGVNMPIQFRIFMPWSFYGILAVIILGIAVTTSFFVTRKKAKENIATLLLESGAST